MRYFALATDYDGTLATHGHVDEPTVAALRRFCESGRKLVLVTGRELHELSAAFPDLDLFDWVVAENGGLLFQPATGEQRALAEAPPVEFLTALRERGVSPLSVGRAIVATWVPHEVVVLETIHALGLELNVIFNKGAVMVLPAGVTKATGLAAAVRELGLSPHNVVGIGDAENDHALLAACGCSAAVANALAAVKERADLVTQLDHGAGVIELIDRLLADDLADVPSKAGRRELAFRGDGREFRVPDWGVHLRFVAANGALIPSAAANFVESLQRAGFQFCAVEFGDGRFRGERVTTLGDARGAPPVQEVMAALADPGTSLVVRASAIEPAARAGYLRDLCRPWRALRASHGRPHWLVLDDEPLAVRCLADLPAGGVAYVARNGEPSTAHTARANVQTIEEG